MGTPMSPLSFLSSNLPLFALRNFVREKKNYRIKNAASSIIDHEGKGRLGWVQVRLASSEGGKTEGPSRLKSVELTNQPIRPSEPPGIDSPLSKPMATNDNSGLATDNTRHARGTWERWRAMAMRWGKKKEKKPLKTLALAWGKVHSTPWSPWKFIFFQRKWPFFDSQVQEIVPFSRSGDTHIR